MDKWLYTYEKHETDQITTGIIAAVFLAFSNVTSYYILNHILTDSSNTMHVVAAILTCVTLTMDAIGDCFVFQRYKLWESNNYAMAIAGLVLMIVGIVTLQTSTPAKIIDEEDSGEESEELLESRILSIDAMNKQKADSLTPPPSLVPCAKNGKQHSY